MGTSRVRWFAGIVMLVLFMGLLSACSGPKAIDATLTSYKITMSDTTAKSGKITFHVKNDATDMEHEFVVVKTDLDAAQLPVDSDGNVIEDQVNGVGEVEVPKGESKDLELELEPGHYAIICNQPGHYKQGMYVNFTVQ